MENKKLTITIPTLPFSLFSSALLNSYTVLKQKFQTIVILFSESFSSARTKTKFSIPTLNLKRMVPRMPKKKTRTLLMLIVPALLIVVLVTVVAQTIRNQQATPVNAESQNNGILSATEVNKPFSFPLTDDAGKEIGKFSYNIQQAELRNEIIVKGQRAYAAQGRMFLIVNLQLKNELKQGLQINSRDYIRLSVNGNKEDLLAPEIHNDPVEVQAISTKFTRVGFAVNEKDKNYILIVGEIDGDKQEIPVKF